MPVLYCNALIEHIILDIYTGWGEGRRKGKGERGREDKDEGEKGKWGREWR